MKRNVAILVFDEVEVLDFAGPFEVFAVTNELGGDVLFQVNTLAPGAREIRARNGLRVVADHTIATAPAPNVIIVPGGVGTRPLLRDATLLEWLRTSSAGTEVIASVCTGALVLGKAGLLNGLTATTHFENLDELRQVAPAARVSGEKRFYDHGRIATAAGISAGIDLSLHLVSRLLGEEVAQRTARVMEYHWPNDGGAHR